MNKEVTGMDAKETGERAAFDRVMQHSFVPKKIKEQIRRNMDAGIVTGLVKTSKDKDARG